MRKKWDRNFVNVYCEWWRMFKKIRRWAKSHLKHFIKEFHEELILVTVGVAVLTELYRAWDEIGAFIDEKFSEKRSIIDILVLFFVLFVFSFSLFVWRAMKSRKMEEFMKNEIMCRPVWKAMAYDNARIDKDLFHHLFINILNPILARPEVIRGLGHARVQIEAQIQISDNTITENIRNILSSIARIMSVHTGDQCAACLKVLANSDSDGVPQIHTVARDSTSEADRRKSPLTQAKNSDSGLEKVMSDPGGYFVSNDLRELEIDGKYKNTHDEDWANLFNSTLIVPVRNLNREAANPVLGALIVDNMNGGLDNPDCVHYLVELAWRVSVMFYRLGTIGALRAKIYSGFHGGGPPPGSEIAGKQ